MLRGVFPLLILVAAVRAEEPGRGARPVAERPRIDPLLDAEVEAWIARDRAGEVDYFYDHFRIWVDPRFEISLGVWRNRLTGPIRFGETDVLDLSRGLGLDDVELSPMWGIRMHKDSWEFMVDGYLADLSGTLVVDVAFELPTDPPTPVEIGDTVSSRLEVTNVRLLGGWFVFERPALNVSLLLGLSSYRLRGFVRSETADATFDYDVTLPIPVYGLALSGRFGRDRRWQYRVEAAGIAISADVFGGNLVDVRATLGYRVNAWLVVRGGYRYADVGVFFRNVRVDFKLQGPFLELVGTF